MQHHRPVTRLSQFGAFDGVGAFRAERCDKARERDDDGMESRVLLAGLRSINTWSASQTGTSERRWTSQSSAP